MISLITKYRRFAIPAGSVLLLSIFGGIFLFFRSGGDTANPRKGPLTEAVYALGTVKSDQIFKLKAAIPLGVKSVPVHEGDYVKRGQTLVVTDSGTALHSPMDGTVTSITINEGELVVTGMPMFIVQDLTRLHVELSLDQESALRVRPGQKAELSFETIRGHRSHGEVEKVYPNEGQFIVRVKVSDLPRGVLPDMTADTAIEVERKENVMQIPLAAVRNGKITLLRDGKRVSETVKLGIINGEWGELIEGDVRETDSLILLARH